MITVLEKRRDDQVPPKIKTYIYKCSNCGSVVKFDNTDIREEIYYNDVDHYMTCPECNHIIDIWGISKWRHRIEFYKLFHRIKENKEE